MVKWTRAEEEIIMQKRGIKRMRLMGAIIALLFIAFLVIRTFFEESRDFSPLYLKSDTLIFALWILIILFGVTFLFILARNLLKMYFERHHEKSGHGFKNRLVLFFIGFSIVPTLLLFFFATDIISRSIEQWFKTPIETVIANIDGIKSNYYNSIASDLEHFAAQIAPMIQQQRMYTQENRNFLKSRLSEKMAEYKLDVINIYRNQKEEYSIFHPRIPLQEYKNLPINMVYLGLGGTGFRQIDELNRGELVRNGVAVDIEGGEKLLVIAGKYFPESYTSSLSQVTAMVRKYTQLRALKAPVKNTYILLFIFITILIIFAASWLGFYLAKGITVPIEKLISATSEIANGNLDVRIDYTAKDEFNTLISEFNRMAIDLKDNQSQLNRRTIQLRHRRQFIETILKNITSGVIAINARGEIIAINPEAARMLSLEAPNALKKHYAAVISETIYQEIHELITRALETRFKSVEKEVDLKVRGRVLSLGVKITHIRDTSRKRFAGLLVVMTDLTALIKAQRMLVWREVAKRIAHEIKNPLTPIQISAQRILRSVDQPDEKFRSIVEDSLGIIQQEINSIKNLADEFANFARLPQIKYVQGDVNDILENLVRVYSSVYQEAHFNARLDPNLPPIRLDVEQIKRVLVNVLDNALEAMDKTGEIEIVSRYNPENKFVTIEVADNGAGISDEDKSRIFLPYISNKSTGTGLGLSIAHTIIEEHNGLISVVDNHPHGARFIIELPA
jgi:two-component system, NtrC family, nitrogen regulation sensor histidine kinase NtrY